MPLADGQVIELGQHRVRHIDTPHVPHAWEARVLYEETTGTLLCGDLFTQLGDPPALTGDDIVEAAAQAEDVFGASCLTARTGSTIRGLAELAPSTLAVMHGPASPATRSKELLALADEYDRGSLLRPCEQSASVDSQTAHGQSPIMSSRHGVGRRGRVQPTLSDGDSMGYSFSSEGRSCTGAAVG